MAKPVRIGAIVPSTNPVVEPDFYSVVPREITVHFERMWNGRWGNQPRKPEDEAYEVRIGSREVDARDNVMFGMDITLMNEDVERGVRSLANVTPDLLVYACTGGTWHKGTLAYDRDMAEKMEAVSGVPAITAVTSCIEAMRFMGTRRVSVAGPYRNSHLHAALKPLLEEAGFEVLNLQGEPWMRDSMNVKEIDLQEPSVIADYVPTVAHVDADTVFLPGTAWRALEVAEELEKKLGKLVITVNQATIWNALRKVGWSKPIEGYGRLLRNFGPAVAT